MLTFNELKSNLTLLDKRIKDHRDSIDRAVKKVSLLIDEVESSMKCKLKTASTEAYIEAQARELVEEITYPAIDCMLLDRDNLTLFKNVTIDDKDGFIKTHFTHKEDYIAMLTLTVSILSTLFDLLSWVSSNRYYMKSREDILKNFVTHVGELTQLNKALTEHYTV